MFHDQLVLGVHRRLHVVTDLGTLADFHRPAVGIGQRHLGLAADLQLLQPVGVLLAALLELVDLRLQLRGTGPGRVRFNGIGGIELPEIAVDLGVDLGERGAQLRRAEIAPLAVDRPELAAVDGDQFATEQFQFPTHQRELATDRAQRGEVVLAEIGDGLEVGPQLAQQPQQFDVALGLAFEPPTGAQPVEVAVQIQAQQIAGLVRRAAGGAGGGALKAGRGQVKTLHERIQKAHGIVGADVVLQPLWQQPPLLAIRPFDVTHNASLVAVESICVLAKPEDFSHSLAHG